MANILEPYVKVTESVVETPTLNTGSADFIVSGVIRASSGSSEPQLVTSIFELLNFYNRGNNLTKDSDITLHNAYKLIQNCNLLLCRATKTRALKAITSLGDTILYKTTKYLNINSTLSLIITNPLVWAFSYGNYIFYCGTNNYSTSGKILIKVTDANDLVEQLSALSDFEVISHTYTTLSNTDLIELWTNQIGAASIAGVTLVNTEISNINLSLVAYLLIGTKLSFADSDTYELTVSTSTILTLNGVDYEISLDTEATSESGVSTYIEYLNSMSIPFSVIVLNKDLVLSSVASTVWLVPNTVSEVLASSDYINALNKLVEQTDYYIDGFSDLGLVDVALYSAYQSAAQDKMTTVALSIDKNLVDVPSIQHFVQATSIDDRHVIFHTPFDKTTSVLGFETFIAPSVYYWERVIANRNGNNEFAPTFEATNGRVAMSNPLVLFTKVERTALLQYRVNTVVFNKKTGVMYFNDNYTSQKTLNVLSEDQNQRLHTKISRDWDQIMF